MKSLHTWGGWFRSKTSGNILDVALKWRPEKLDFTLYVFLRVCVCVCVCVCVSCRWPPIWLDKGKTHTSTLDMQVDSKHPMQRWELKTYSKFMHGCLCVLTSRGCVCVCVCVCVKPKTGVTNMYLSVCVDVCHDIRPQWNLSGQALPACRKQKSFLFCLSSNYLSVIFTIKRLMLRWDLTTS